MSRLAACIRLAVIPAVAAACKLTTMPRVTQVVAGVVSLAPDAREYDRSSRPPTAILTLDNATRDDVTVRRCLAGAVSQDPVSADLILQKEAAGGAWKAVDLHRDCREPGAELVVAPAEQAVVARIVLKEAGRYRARLPYVIGIAAEPTDTVTSDTFVVR
jgi:hypothetical protein